MALPADLLSFSTYLALFEDHMDMYVDFHSLPDDTPWTVRFNQPYPYYDDFGPLVPSIGSHEDLYPNDGIYSLFDTF